MTVCATHWHLRHRVDVPVVGGLVVLFLLRLVSLSNFLLHLVLFVTLLTFIPIPIPVLAFSPAFSLSPGLGSDRERFGFAFWVHRDVGMDDIPRNQVRCRGTKLAAGGVVVK
jgi:hypothetical protein